MRQEEHDTTCERVRGRMERLLDGGLGPVEEARDLGHLEACAGCEAEREGWSSFLAVLRRAEAPAGAAAGELRLVQGQLTRRLDERIARERSARRTFHRLSLAAAAAALVLTLGLFALAESTSGLPRAAQISRLELPVPRLGDLLSTLGSLGVAR